jgi:hypothetical protein
MKNQADTLYDDQEITNYKTAMKKNETLQNEIHSALHREPISRLQSIGLNLKIGRYARIFSYMVLFAGIALIFTSCMGGYVASEPSYTEYARPQRPSETHIWISGDWNWNSQSQVYVQKAGYWDRPRQGQVYVAGNWQTSSRGKSWNKGHWQKDSHQDDNRHSDRHQDDNRNR